MTRSTTLPWERLEARDSNMFADNDSENEVEPNSDNDTTVEQIDVDLEHEPEEEVKYNIFVYNSLYFFSNF